MRFLEGRYGLDLLSIVLLALSMIFDFWRPTLMLSLLLFAVAIYRSLSRDFTKRTAELMVLLNLLKKLGIRGLDRFSGHGNGFGSYANRNSNGYVYQNSTNDSIKNRFERWYKEKKNYKIVSCPKCKQKLRLPKRKGKIVAKCKKCMYEFKLKT